MTPASVSVNPMLAEVDETKEPSAGPEPIDGAGGATVSAVQVREVVPDVFPTESLARTWNVCEPCARLV